MTKNLQSLWAKICTNNWVILNRAETTLAIIIISALVASALFALFRFIEPPPPKTIKISTGAKTGAYYAYAQRYAAELKKHGITLEILDSSGSVQNLARLNDPKSGVALGFIQTGVGDQQGSPDLESLASIAYEPVWVLSKSTKTVARLIDTKGKRIAIGADGSGSQPVALALLKANGIDNTNATLLTIGAAEAYPQLQQDQVDVIMTVAAPNAPIIVQALDAGLTAMDFDHADAYTRRFPWLSKVTLPKGSASFASNAPTKDIQLIAANANLVARADAHPAITFLLMDIASEVHAGSGLVHNVKQFPNEQSLQFVQSDESKRFFKTGRPFLQRFLPFWLANLIERLLVSIVPVLAIAIPLIKLVPAYFDFHEKSEILQLYEQGMQTENSHKAGKLTKTEALEKITTLDQRLEKLNLGASRHIEVYNLHSHLELIRSRVLGS